jgi:hypothetical protein
MPILWLKDIEDVRSKMLVDYHRPHIVNRVRAHEEDGNLLVGLAWALGIELVVAAIIVIGWLLVRG